ncbi:Protein ASP-2 b [Aphelenchoides avenae]|nr:Protein ASP-2 b [Aphelenchus avenae]
MNVGVNGFPMTIHDAWFGQAKEIDSTFEDAPFDGVFGLGYSTIAVGGAKPLLTAAIDQNLMWPMFTVRLTDNGGFMTLGADDTEHCSPLIDWVPLDSLTYYRFYMESYGWKGKTTYAVWQTTAAGIGDSFIRGPPAIIESLAKDVGATTQSNSDYYFLPCDSELPDFVLVAIDTHNIVAGDLLLPTSDPSSCILAIRPLDSNGILPSWILGTPLMRHNCGVYDVSGFNYGIADSY